MTLEAMLDMYEITDFRKAVIPQDDYNEFHILFIFNGQVNRRAERLRVGITDHESVFRNLLRDHIECYNIPISKRKVINNILSEI